MKLSQISTEKAADILCEITPYVANIATNEDLLAELRNAIDKEKANTRAELLLSGAEKITKLIPILLRNCRDDLFGILGALNGKTAEEIGAQSFPATMNQVREIIQDKELLDFFRSCASSEGSE